MSTQTNVLSVWTDAIAELREAASEYLANSRVLSEECSPAQTRLEQALSQFTDHANVLPKDYRGMEGRIRELESDLSDLSGQLELQGQRARRVRELLFLTGDFAIEQGADPVDEQVNARLAEMQTTKRGKGAKS